MEKIKEKKWSDKSKLIDNYKDQQKTMVLKNIKVNDLVICNHEEEARTCGEK